MNHQASCLLFYFNIELARNLTVFQFNVVHLRKSNYMNNHIDTLKQ